MRVDWAIPCRYAEVNGNLGTIIGAGIDQVYVPAVPAPISITIAARLVAPLDDLGESKPHEIRCVARNEALEEVGEVSGTLAWPVPEDAREDWLLGIQLPIVIQFEAATEGTFTLVLGVDGNTTQVPIHVVTAA